MAGQLPFRPYYRLANVRGGCLPVEWLRLSFVLPSRNGRLEIAMTGWPLQDAGNKFSAGFDAAMSGELQRETRRGQPAAVAPDVEEYERFCRPGQASLVP